VKRLRSCKHPTCTARPVATLTFSYADSTAVLGPLAMRPEPHTYDLCERHAESLTPPRGWEVIRLQPETVDVGPSSEDLEVLADHVRERGRRAVGLDAPPPIVGGSRYGHLRVLTGGNE
jgi:hypothetical protein